VLAAGRDVALAISPDFLSKATTVGWQSGAMNADVDAAAWAQLGPGLPALDAAGFAQVVPEIANALPPTTPLVLRLRPALPPRIAIAPGPDLATLELGEVHLEVWADLGGSLVEALDLTVHGRVALDPVVSAGSLLFAKSATPATYRFAVARQPLVAVDALALETRLSIVVDALLPGFLGSIQVPLPLVRGAALSNVVIDAEGARGDYLAVAGDL
jgi:hypothetical protein